MFNTIGNNALTYDKEDEEAEEEADDDDAAAADEEMGQVLQTIHCSVTRTGLFPGANVH